MTENLKKDTPALEIRDVTVTVKDGDGYKNILKKANLRLESGKVTGLFGPSGSGKSTLLSVGGLLLTPRIGEIYLGGRNVTKLSQGEKGKTRLEKLGIIFQNSNLIESMTATEQLLLMRSLNGVKIKEKDRDEAAEMLLRVGLEGSENKYPNQLSGGQKQRVNIARALFNNPTVLLADELTSALDTVNSRKVMALIKNLTEEMNVATLLITHSEEYKAHADRAYYIEDGVVSE